MNPAISRRNAIVTRGIQMVEAKRVFALVPRGADAANRLYKWANLNIDYILSCPRGRAGPAGAKRGGRKANGMRSEWELTVSRK